MAAEIRSRAERYRAMLARPQAASARQSYLRRSRRSRTRHPRCCRPSQSRATTPFIAHSHTGCLAEERGGNVRQAGVTVITQFLREYGGKPGTRTKPAPALGAQNTVGVLLAALSDDEIRNTLPNAREVAACGLCPALVCLVGRGAKPGTNAAVWPMLLALAPYVDTALLDAGEVEGCA